MYMPDSTMQSQYFEATPGSRGVHIAKPKVILVKQGDAGYRLEVSSQDTCYSVAEGGCACSVHVRYCPVAEIPQDGIMLHDHIYGGPGAKRQPFHFI